VETQGKAAALFSFEVNQELFHSFFFQQRISTREQLPRSKSAELFHSIFSVVAIYSFCALQGAH
jgi:hypothetical protein